MKQMSLSTTGFERKTKRTRKREFLDEMNLVVPWAELVGLIAPHAPARGAKGGRPPFAVETMLRIHFLQQWFNLSDPAMEEALYDTPMFREFAGLDAGEDNLPDESTIRKRPANPGPPRPMIRRRRASSGAARARQCGWPCAWAVA